jgi:hypothetical protein
MIQGQAVIVALDSQETLVLNETASRIWELCDGTRRIDEIASILAQEFTTTTEAALCDSRLFLEEARAKGILSSKTP